MKNWRELDLLGSAAGFFADNAEYRVTQNVIKVLTR